MRALPAFLLGWLILAAVGVAGPFAQGINNPITNTRTIVQARAVNLAATGDAATVAIPGTITRYQVVAIAVTNCSATPVLAQIGLYTAAAAGGTNLVAATVITGATSAPVIVPLTLAGAVATTLLTATPLYVNVAVANATALTCDFGIRIQDWS